MYRYTFISHLEDRRRGQGGAARTANQDRKQCTKHRPSRRCRECTRGVGARVAVLHSEDGEEQERVHGRNKIGLNKKIAHGGLCVR